MVDLENMVHRYIFELLSLEKNRFRDIKRLLRPEINNYLHAYETKSHKISPTVGVNESRLCLINLLEEESTRGRLF